MPLLEMPNAAGPGSVSRMTCQRRSARDSTHCGREESSAKKQRTRSPSPATAASSAGCELTSDADAATLPVAAAVSSPALLPSSPFLLVGLLRPNLLLLYALLSWWLIVIGYALLSPQLEISISIWLNALVVSAVVGSALNANAWASDRCSLRSHVASAPVACLRFFLIPFCVSSYSAIASRNPREFCWMVPRNATLVGGGVGAIAAEVAALWVAGRWMRRRQLQGGAASAPKPIQTTDAAVQVDLPSLLSAPASPPRFHFGFSSPCSSSSRGYSVHRRSSSAHRFSPAAASFAPRSPALRVEPLATYLGSAITPRAHPEGPAKSVGFTMMPRHPLLLESCATPTPTPRISTPAPHLCRLHPHLLRCIAEYTESGSSSGSIRRVRLSPAHSAFTFQ